MLRCSVQQSRRNRKRKSESSPSSPALGEGYGALYPRGFVMVNFLVAISFAKLWILFLSQVGKSWDR